MSFCKEQKKSAAFATDLFGRGRRTLSPRSTLVGQDGSTVPKSTVFTAVLFSSFCKKRIKKSAVFATDLFGRGRRTLSPRSTLVGQDGSTVPKGTVFTAVLFSSFCKKRIKKSAAFATDLFGRGRRDSFSSLDARRSGRLYRAKGHGIHCRPILALLQEAKKNRLLLQPTFLAGPHFQNPNILPKRKNGYFSLDYRKQ